MASDLILDVRGIGKTYGASALKRRRGLARPAVSDVSFTIRRGETFGLVGESGSGKSTIGKIVYGIETADSGSFTVLEAAEGQDDSKNRRASAPGSTRKRVGMIFQNPYSSLNPRRRIVAILDEALRLGGFHDADDRRVRMEAALASVGLTPQHGARYPHEMSGGQLQRVAIARALVVEPELVICDEAVSALDVSVQAQVLNILRELQQDRGLSYLFITHDMSVARYMSHRVGVLQRGVLVEEGTSPGLFESPRNAYTQSLIASVPADAPERRHLVERRPAGASGRARHEGESKR